MVIFRTSRSCFRDKGDLLHLLAESQKNSLKAASHHCACFNPIGTASAAQLARCLQPAHTSGLFSPRWAGLPAHSGFGVTLKTGLSKRTLPSERSKPVGVCLVPPPPQWSTTSGAGCSPVRSGPACSDAAGDADCDTASCNTVTRPLARLARSHRRHGKGLDVTAAQRVASVTSN